jgi:hypothetical protein
MVNADIQSQKQNLISKLQGLDNANLLQRVSDFLDGVLAATGNTTADWWNELPESVKKDHEQGEKDGEEGRVVPLDDFLKKYRK